MLDLTTLEKVGKFTMIDLVYVTPLLKNFRLFLYNEFNKFNVYSFLSKDLLIIRIIIG